MIANINHIRCLAELVQINPAPARRARDGVTGFVPMHAVKRDGGIFPELRHPGQLGRHARQFLGGDLLLPCMEHALRNRRIGIHARDGETLYCSAEFAVLRPDTTQIHPKFLYHWLVHQACKALLPKLQGTAQKRVAREDIEALPISLPPLPAQERLAVLMDNAIGQKQVATRLLQNANQTVDHLFLFWQARVWLTRS